MFLFVWCMSTTVKWFVIGRLYFFLSFFLSNLKKVLVDFLCFWYFDFISYSWLFYKCFICFQFSPYNHNLSYFYFLIRFLFFWFLIFFYLSIKVLLFLNFIIQSKFMVCYIFFNLVLILLIFFLLLKLFFFSI